MEQEQAAQQNVNICFTDGQAAGRKCLPHSFKMTALYEAAVQIITTRLDIIEKECFDVYEVKDALLSDGTIQLVEEKDYIEHPKENGFRIYPLIRRANNL